MTHWIIVLMVYYSGSGRIDIVPLEDVIFDDPITCHEVRLSDEFQDHLREDYKDIGVAYVRPFCKLIHKHGTLAYNNLSLEMKVNNGAKNITISTGY